VGIFQVSNLRQFFVPLFVEITRLIDFSTLIGKRQFGAMAVGGNN